ncbi:hypothetical protein SAMN05216588_105300 [Pseudomonas flavescens]|uniref:Type III secretion protein HrpT n=2 Tax=Phytopseudomonas flavescens TaxID=29435 RepID=A0A1G8DL78_9GAMM|nr:hypothetical protein SAMN05216588_105300 [Pseudomonas flavescens]
MIFRALAVVSIFALLAGCASPRGCSGQACKRPDSTPRSLVIWWPEDMRQGLNEQDRQGDLDHTVTPLEN